MSFDLKVRMYYEDTDAGGIVYHANYLRYAERARTEYLNHIGIAHKKVFGFVVTNVEMKFIKPAVLADEITVRTVLEKFSGARCEFSQNIYRDDVLLVELKVKVAFVNQELKPIRAPEEFKKAILKDIK